MADERGKLTKEQREKLGGWLKLNWKDRACPFCQAPGGWIVSDTVGVLLTFADSGTISIGGPNFPLIVVVHERCGYTILVNAIIAGITEAIGDVSKKEKSDG